MIGLIQANTAGEMIQHTAAPAMPQADANDVGAQRCDKLLVGADATLGTPAGIAAKQNADDRVGLAQHQQWRNQRGEHRFDEHAAGDAGKAAVVVGARRPLRTAQTPPNNFGRCTTRTVARNRVSAFCASKTGHLGNSETSLPK